MGFFSDGYWRDAIASATPGIATARIAFAGYSFGGMVGVHFAGIERRIKAAVMTAPYGGNVTARTNANLLPGLASYT